MRTITVLTLVAFCLLAALDKAVAGVVSIELRSHGT